MLKACKHREPVNFSFGFSETPVVAAGQVEAFPFAGKTKSIFARDPPPAVASPRGRVWMAALPPAPVLDPVRGTVSQDRIEDLANRILARLDAVKVPLCDAPVPVFLNCLPGWLHLAGAFHCPLKIVNGLTATLKDDVAG